MKSEFCPLSNYSQAWKKDEYEILGQQDQRMDSVEVNNHTTMDHRRRRRRSNATRFGDDRMSKEKGSITHTTTSSDNISVGSYRWLESTPSAICTLPNRRKKRSQHFSGFPEEQKRDSIFAVIGILCLTVSVLYLLFQSSLQLGNVPEEVDPIYVSKQTEKSILSRIETAKKRYDWPWSTFPDEIMEFDLIAHPITKKLLSLPPFYVDINEGKLFTPQMARSIGFKLLNSREEEPNTRTIFVGIASYRNPNCRYTVESIFSQAKHPERIRVAIVDQMDPKVDLPCNMPTMISCEDDPSQLLCVWHKHIDWFPMIEAEDAVGPAFARHVMNRMYRGEYYTLQIHAQVEFVRDWDVSIIQQHDSTHNEMAILSTYLTSKETKTNANYVICNASYQGSGKNRYLKHYPDEQPLTVSPIQGSPYLHPYWSSSFSFSRGHFLLNIPYDPYLILTSTDDEEISMALRAWTHGYDFYVPEKSVCVYSSSQGASGDEVLQPMYLEHYDQETYELLHKQSLNRLYEIIHMGPKIPPTDIDRTEAERYGLGQVRTVQRFFQSFGIHASERITERKLCEFVASGTMHQDFSVFLRDDSMGIDYNQINFHFHELIRIHNG